MAKEEKSKQIKKLHDDQMAIIEGNKDSSTKDKLTAFFQLVMMENEKGKIASQFTGRGKYIY